MKASDDIKREIFMFSIVTATSREAGDKSSSLLNQYEAAKDE